MNLYRVKGWQRFQHYKDRNPPWIRLYKGLLDDYEFHCLPVASRALAPMLWLLASDNPDPSSGAIEGPDERIAFRIRMDPKEFLKAIKPLIEKGFIERLHCASGLIAESGRDATPETETETDNPQPPAKATVTIMPYVDIPVAWKLEAMREKGWPENVTLDIWRGFYEYWRNGKGKSTRREEWSATWRTWYRKENIKPSQGGTHGVQSKFNLAVEATERARLKREQLGPVQAG